MCSATIYFLAECGEDVGECVLEGCCFPYCSRVDSLYGNIYLIFQLVSLLPLNPYMLLLGKCDSGGTFSVLEVRLFIGSNGFYNVAQIPVCVDRDFCRLFVLIFFAIGLGGFVAYFVQY